MKRAPSQLPQHVQRRAAVIRLGRRVSQLREEGLLMEEVCERLGITYRRAHYAERKAREAAHAPVP